MQYIYFPKLQKRNGCFSLTIYKSTFSLLQESVCIVTKHIPNKRETTLRVLQLTLNEYWVFIIIIIIRKSSVMKIFSWYCLCYALRILELGKNILKDNFEF